MNIELKGKRALIGGASKGLGKAIAQQLALSGASVTVMARNEESLLKLVNELPTSAGQKHEHLTVDFSDLDNYTHVIDTFFKNHTIDILVNNTNGPQSGSVLEHDAADYQKAFNLLFQTVQYTTRLAIESMKKNNFGRIINLTSRTVREPADNLALSNTIRAAVVAWGKTLSRAVGKYNITVNNILTGNFDTERLNELFALQAKAQNTTIEIVTKKAEADIPLQRLGRPEELAHVVAFLSSEQASYVTGTSIPVDGGLLKSI